ncbi:metallophosphoesterase [Bradyrhizobium sp. 4]|jgi:Icc-related predicted phosphoesterase|uniref:metallophosphoesterase n=1 Tax=unclassified Bradyrhizobium TaxID=2631580 RepID=UPI001FF80EFC|nr:MULTISPECIES: metallophosphoesterase [unclassified Bradyrhizobium]MCK1396929.1 metallophosphoesterase [Bradyrhizobium sp. 39]MCK1747863.1 metallophosphoesterase [Bradyrhizobium sp. 135]UPJ33316.1 metallophosphoesterase [Bradyrhizobium sp. 4]
MNIQILSDLHADVHPIKPITIRPDVDAVVVAGDVCEGAVNAFAYLRRIVPMPIPILMVAGNHEYYHRFLPDELTLARAKAPTFNIHFLENDTVVLNGVCFVGATLWTDYRIFGETNIGASMSACAAGMNDHRRIGWQKRPWLRFRPQEAALLHHQSRAYIDATLSTGFGGPIVVISHHAVHWNSVLPKYRTDPVTAAFVSDMTAIIEAHRPTMWVHGHVHNSSDYRVANSRVAETRIVCNPHGYGSENPAFDGSLVIEVGG